MNRPVIRVVAAVLQRAGRILIGQRRRTDSHSLKWEFPGGKIERGETPAEALARELEEELGIQAIVGEELYSHSHEYPRRTIVQLTFFGVQEFAGEPQNLAFEQIVWVERELLPQYDFVDGDLEFVQKLAAGMFPETAV